MNIITKSSISTGVAALLVGAALMGAATARAETWPGSCADFTNNTGTTVTLVMTYPSLLHWDFAGHTGPFKLMDKEGNILISPTGDWIVHTDPEDYITRVHNGLANLHSGCNGSEEMTVN
ncbi:hypothetical protein [Nocardia sp. NBC_01327]|uniref:hypothetical protein n=1 Tax=Nocardia sp. NBC_01327 TaxID=2903593 RepID=UPI002E12570A|nr:hypothetical protein OG326_42285 [Nocardia sp. NBC_01327]